MSQILEGTPLPDTLTPHTGTPSLNSQSQTNEIWGHLLSQRIHLPSVDLVNDSYKVGRVKTCDIIFNEYNLKDEILFTLSKEHFIISRDSTLVPYIKDLSRNGTFINGSLIGQGNVCALCNNDIISLGKSSMQVYKYQMEINDENCEYYRKYKETRYLGRGAFGEVVLAFSLRTSRRFAVKKIPYFRELHGLIASNNVKIRNEVNILRALQHPCVIHLEDIIYSDSHVNIVLEYMEGGELSERILRYRRLSEFISKLYFHQMLLAVQYLHDKGITHRDLKPENILLASNRNQTLLKVTDFGLSKFVQTESMMVTHCGTPCYTAPEILKNQGTDPYNNQVDVWSLGVILFQCLFGEFPFKLEDSLKSLYYKILHADYNFPKEISNNLTENSLKLIERMLVVDPEQRITINELLKHTWISGDRKMLLKTQQLMYPEET